MSSNGRAVSCWRAKLQELEFNQAASAVCSIQMVFAICGQQTEDLLAPKTRRFELRRTCTTDINASGRARTCDLWLRRPTLFQLSYTRLREACDGKMRIASTIHSTKTLDSLALKLTCITRKGNALKL